jgi:hypothetical protein
MTKNTITATPIKVMAVVTRRNRKARNNCIWGDLPAFAAKGPRQGEP